MVLQRTVQVCQLLVDGRALHYLSSRLWRQACTDWICWRNYVVAPFRYGIVIQPSYRRNTNRIVITFCEIL